MSEDQGIPTKAVYEMVASLLKFPYPQICRHLVAAELLSALKDHTPVGTVIPQLITACFHAQDDEALRIIRIERPWL